MQYGIPSFRLEKDIVQAEVDVLKQMGVEIKCDVHVGKDITLDDLREEGYNEDIDLKPALMDYYMRHMKDDTFISWIALDEGRIIGTKRSHPKCMK